MTRLSLRNVSKSFAGTKALVGASLDLEAGEVHALMGENGAGKSTLIRILAGVTPADRMDATMDGVPITLSSTSDAAALGFRFVHQEINIVPQLSVAENILLGRPYPRRLGLLVDWRDLNRQAADALGGFGATAIDPRAKAARLSTGDQMVMVLAGMMVSSQTRPQIFVLDEPTAALTHAESERLFAVIRDLRAAGAAILYVSHRLNEVMDLADRVTVMRDGRTVMTRRISETGKDDIIRAMTGRDVKDAYPPRTTAVDDAEICAVSHLTSATLQDIDFQVRRGEILGIAGLENAGQSEILRAFLGLEGTASGGIRLGNRAGPRSPSQAWRRGVAYVPRERRREGLMLTRSITANTVLPHLRRLSRAGTMSSPARERMTTRRLAREVRLKFSRLEQPCYTLSGGNQQKVLFARAMAGAPDLILLDEPTRGVDVGARYDIYRLIRAFSGNGGTVILTSTDLPELLGLCDRILIVRDGAQQEILNTAGLDAASLLARIYGDSLRPPVAPEGPAA
ncbi:MAG: sugar ABC transporter ATP-binding protein [Inquilinaceae bacterium]